MVKVSFSQKNQNIMLKSIADPLLKRTMLSTSRKDTEFKVL